MNHEITLTGGPADGRLTGIGGGLGEILVPVLVPRIVGIYGAYSPLMHSSRYEIHRYSTDGQYLGIKAPQDFRAPFPDIELFCWWATVKMVARRWWPQVSIDRSTTERKLTVSVSIPAANGRR